MARAKDAPIQVGGQIDPYVLQSMQQGRQLAENRLLTAMRERGAGERTAIQEAGATQRTAMQTKMQRDIAGAQIAAQDRRAAEDEAARREDRKFTTVMAEADRGFQAKQAELNRDQQNAIISGDRKAKDEIEKRREALRRFNIELSMDAQERNTNAVLSIIKGGLNRETLKEKAKTVLSEEAEKFDKDKDVYKKTIKRVSEAVELDKRMDLPILDVVQEKIPTAWDVIKGTIAEGPISEIRRYRALKKEVKEGFADPMGVLQDQINDYGGAISLEYLTPGTISKIEDRIQTEDIKTEDINKTLGVLEGMRAAIEVKRKVVDKESKDYDFWQDTQLEISQMRDTLEGLVSSEKKITGSDKETVGARVRYALGTVYDSSLGGQAARWRDLTEGNFQTVFEEMTKPIQVPKLYDITPDMNKYDIEYRTWFNNYLSSRYSNLQETGIEERVE